MKNIWLVRHGESMSQIDENVDGVNPPLSPHGEIQARRLSERLKSIHADIVLVSPLIRAVNTFRLSKYTADIVRYDTRIIESDWGISSYYCAQNFENVPSIAESDGFTAYAQPVRERAESLLQYIYDSPYSEYLLFGHWGVFMEIFKVFTGIPETMPLITEMENTAVSHLYINDEGHRRVCMWNDYTHVNEPKQRS